MPALLPLDSHCNLAIMTIAEDLCTRSNSWAVDWSMTASSECKDHNPLADDEKPIKEPTTSIFNGNYFVQSVHNLEEITA